MGVAITFLLSYYLQPSRAAHKPKMSITTQRATTGETVVDGVTERKPVIEKLAADKVFDMMMMLRGRLAYSIKLAENEKMVSFVSANYKIDKRLVLHCCVALAHLRWS